MNSAVLLINDDAFELATLAEAMRLRGINLSGKSNNLSTAENLFITLQPDVVVIDVLFNSRKGVELANQMRKKNPNLGVVHTTSCPDLRLIGIQEKDVAKSTRLVLKRSMADLDVLCDAIPDSLRAVTANESTVWVNRHLQGNGNSTYAIANELTNIQIETLRLVAVGMSNGEIARLRFVSEKSVEQIVARIAQHLQIESDRKRNLRVLLTNQYHKWVGASEI
ncbi:MAG: LuxR C-terminal-related transcriptional regulator [Actinobacteria bacterium]|nr:LuxR C-terminal-related transcriptional regulator [Actinomycetota bacterium]